MDKSAYSLGAKGAVLLIVDYVQEGHYQVNHFSKIWSRVPERSAMYTQKYGHYEKPIWDKLHALPKQSLILDTEFWADEPDLLQRPEGWRCFFRRRLPAVRQSRRQSCC